MADYKKVYIEVRRIINKFKLKNTPIILSEIINSLEDVELSTYKELLQENKYTYDEIIELFGSELGFVAYKNEKRIIYFNDKNKNYGLTRFTVAHELGHYFLNHKAQFNQDGSINEFLYKEMEKEANCFARNLLCPISMYILDNFQYDEEKIYYLMDKFNITYEATITRIDFDKTDRYQISKII